MVQIILFLLFDHLNQASHFLLVDLGLLSVQLFQLYQIHHSCLWVQLVLGIQLNLAVQFHLVNQLVQLVQLVQNFQILLLSLFDQEILPILFHHVVL